MKLFKFFMVFNFSVQTSLFVASCEPVKSFPSISSKTDLTTLNYLFEKNNIEIINFDYLNYINGYFEHNGFTDVLETKKITNNILEVNNSWTEEIKSYYESLSKIYLPIINENVYDFTGMTFIVENIFVDDFSFLIQSSDDNDNDLKSKVSCTMAITILKGWETMGKILLDVSMNESDYFTGTDSFQFINKWMETIYSDIKIIGLDDENRFIVNNFKLDENSIENFKKTLISRESDLKNLYLKEDDINYWSENEKVIDESTGKETIDKIEGFTIKNQKYVFN
ncbi:hypothetical protein [Spiroplasma helicoides]|nr:hypothetical protein [Spiroplasma helicoides]